MGKLTTHVLDVSSGIPAAGVLIQLHAAGADTRGTPLAEVATGKDGRCAAALLEAERFVAGQYVLTFHLASYFRTRNVELPDPPFFETAVIHLGIANPEQHYHVPLLISPWSYSVYRGG
jgi:5-hydroxyisourate hydrolase